MFPIVGLDREEMAARYAPVAVRVIREIREDVAKIEYVPPRNRHERRKAAALARRAAR